MSLASYIGCNIEIDNSNDDSHDIILIRNNFSDEDHRMNVKVHQFTTPYVYEVSTDWGIEISKYNNPGENAESKRKLLRLCEIMDEYLEQRDYFELYSCWVGDETDKRDGELILQLNSFDVHKISIPVKTLVRFTK